MAVFVEFIGNYVARYSNALHAAYHASVVETLESAGDLSTLHVDAGRLDSYKALSAELISRNKVAAASVDTAISGAHESERDRRLSINAYMITSALDSSDEKERAAAQYLEPLVRPYKDVQNEPDDAETASIRGLLADLREEKAAEAVETLGLKANLDKLEEANEAFAALKKTRIQARQSRAMKEPTEEIRRQADEQLKDICDILRATGILATLAEDGAETARRVEELVNEINGITRNYKTSWKMSEAQKNKKENASEPSGDKDKEPDKSDRPVIPDEDEEPTDPGEGEGEDDRPVIPEDPEEGKEEPGKDENGDDLPPIE